MRRVFWTFMWQFGISRYDVVLWFREKLCGISPDARIFTDEQLDTECERRLERLKTPSKYSALIGDWVAPIYCPFVDITFTKAETLEGATIIEGTRIIKSIPFIKTCLASGDRFIVHFPMNLEAPHGQV